MGRDEISIKGRSINYNPKSLSSSVAAFIPKAIRDILF
jgi:hypothetical protein